MDNETLQRLYDELEGLAEHAHTIAHALDDFQRRVWLELQQRDAVNVLVTELSAPEAH